MSKTPNSSSRWGIAQAAGALVAKPQGQKAARTDRSRSEGTTPKAGSVPPVAKPRVSVAQPQHNRYAGGPFGSAGRAAAERDARLGRRVVFGVLVIALLIFGTRLAGLWEPPAFEQKRQRGDWNSGFTIVARHPALAPGLYATAAPEISTTSGEKP